MHYDHQYFVLNCVFTPLFLQNLTVCSLQIKAIKFQLEFKVDQKGEFDVNRYFSNRKDFVKTIRQQVQVGAPKFKFEDAEMDNWFAAISKQSDFDGAVEVERVGQNLNEKTATLLVLVATRC